MFRLSRLNRFIQSCSSLAILLALASSCGQTDESEPLAVTAQKVGQVFVRIVNLKSGAEPIINRQGGPLSSTAQFAKSHGTDVAINLSFFDSRHRPLALTVSNGSAWRDTYEEPFRNREMGIFYCKRGAAWSCAIAMDYEKYRSAVAASTDLAATGYLKLVEDGRVVMTETHGTRARTAVGVSVDGKRVIIAAVPEGHTDGNLNRLALVMRQAGTHDAINFDGGGSTALVERINGQQQSLVISSRTPPVPLGFSAN